MNDYDAIELKEVKSIVSNYASIVDSKTYILNEKVDFNPLAIKNNIKLTSAAIELINNEFEFSLDGFENINDIFDSVKKGYVLNSVEISKVLNYHNHCQRIKNIFSKINDDNILKNYSDSIEVCKELADIIDKVIDNYGNVKESASPKLIEINNNIKNNQTYLQKSAASFISKNNSYLQENNHYLRNNRLVFLFKNANKNLYKGIQYDQTSSGLATYVEPDEFVELNNTKLSLENQRNDEINRILKELSIYISKYADMYISNFDSILMLDVIFSKAKYGKDNGGVIANLNDSFNLTLKDAIHPLLDRKSAVFNSYNLSKPYKGVVISGTNTGGKTVSLKTIGLSVLLSYLGVPVIASYAEIPLFNNVYIDIDDNQSINNALSTYSAHISNINNILNNADDKSLILIDELISGTDPKEAQAISLAILDEILKINSYFVITTHFDDIKQYAYKHEQILLSSVGFDSIKLIPTYKYYENSIGTSNAIDISKRYFDNKEIVESALKYLNENKTKEEQLMDKLSLQINENEILKKDLQSKIQEYDVLNDKLNKKLENINDTKRDLIDHFNDELNDKLEKIILSAKEKLNSINSNNKNANIVKEIIDLKANNEIKNKLDNENLNINDHVSIISTGQVGIISDIHNDKVHVDVNGVNVITNSNNIKRIDFVKKENTYKPKASISSVKRELNLVGKRVEEALVSLDNYLDSAYGSNLSQVKIIHGFGTGQLRKAIWNHLKNNKYIDELKFGDEYDGGSNVTIVKFKR